jgi:hypothetical protein
VEIDINDWRYGFGHAQPFNIYPDGPDLAFHSFSWSDRSAAIRMAPCECPKIMSKFVVWVDLENILSMTISSLSSNPSYFI